MASDWEGPETSRVGSLGRLQADRKAETKLSKELHVPKFKLGMPNHE